VSENKILLQFFSDPRFERITVEAQFNGKFLFALSHEAENEYKVELRNGAFISGRCVQSLDFDTLRDALDQARKAVDNPPSGLWEVAQPKGQ
jgi:hypothetical protein